MVKVREETVISILRAYADGFPSTYDVCKSTGIKSRSQMYAYIRVLLDRGWLSELTRTGWYKYAITEAGSVVAKASENTNDSSRN